MKAIAKDFAVFVVILFVVAFVIAHLTGCAAEVRPGSEDANTCTTRDLSSGQKVEHPCDATDPWIDESSGLACTDSYAQVGDTCTFNGQLGITELR